VLVLAARQERQAATECARGCRVRGGFAAARARAPH
jgi:hypothetical protein